MTRYSFILLFLIACFCLSGQEQRTTNISFHPMYGKQALLFNDTSYFSERSGLVKFQILKLYISAIAFYKNDTLIYLEKNSYHLLDSDQPGSFQISLPATGQYNKLKFNIGIDSITSVSGALSGALDPAKGMYWAWHSGYINVKLEGTCSNCKNLKKEFQLHLGGYQQPYYCMLTKELLIEPNTAIDIGIDLQHFLDASDLSVRDHIMSPGAESLQLSKNLCASFSLLKK